MKTAFFILPLLIGVLTVTAQSVKKYPIGNSGCSLNSYCEQRYSTSLSDDSSKVYTGECKQDEVSYGVICIKLLNPVENLFMAQDLVVAYLDYLKKNFDIVKAAGYSKNYMLQDNRDTRGVLDYWEDIEGNKWKIKAWTDGKYIGCLYAYSKKELPETKINTYLDGFRMPGM